MKPEEVFASLTAFQQALAGHFDWLHRWYQAVLNREEGARIPDPASIACPFDHWHRNAGDTPFAQFSGFAQLAVEHDEVHDKAAQLSGRAQAGLTVTTSDYETLMMSVLEFGATAQSVEREVWKVLATVDPLTGLANRQSMRSHLMGERDRSLRQKLPLALALADIDHFKKINDGFGHAQGDKVLRAVATVLKATVRPYDVVYRYGGEEFLLCLPGTNAENGALVLERIRAAIEALALSDERGTPIPVTATFGIAEINADLSVDDAIEQADRALYDGKLNGRNRVVIAP
ncbi:diguanylate cyclase [Magnetospirillum sulfuroxidans]|uniref:diguanylate cyclase n=1 Tax=Magnetospirillum sulfuroxidans TaxID=611300 RepID=A0ABS5IF98_9PROT|nr:diguanylate cyclase [Magnetospirillum sulfuroxidans]MBR9972852.1 diguanylate cyclase [Magnetospirillum sulfuroxidans]